MIKKTVRLALRITAFVVSSFLLVAVTLILARAMSVRNGPDLEWWHSEKISAEFSAKDRLTVTTLDQYMTKEADVFQELKALEQRAATVEMQQPAVPDYTQGRCIVITRHDRLPVFVA